MATATNIQAVAGSRRYDELKAMLETRRRELARDVRGKIRDARTASSSEMCSIRARAQRSTSVSWWNACGRAESRKRSSVSTRG